MAISHRLTPRFLTSCILLASACIGARLLAEEAVEPEPFPDMAPVVGEYLENDYYDQKRFQPHVMVDRALRYLRDAETSIQTSWANETITLTVDTKTTQIPAPEPTNLKDAMALLESVRLVVDKSGFKDARARELDYDMINGALMCLDPHTVLMAPEVAKGFREDMDGKFYGIGAFLNQEEGLISIQRVMPGLPADRAGVQDGDIILGINGESTAGLELDQAVHRIKGPKGTQVVLSVERRAVDHAIDLPITRDLVQVTTMQQFRSGDVGYVRMDEFNNLIDRDLAKAIEQLSASGPMKAFVLDLRFNGGGLLDKAKKVSNFFMPKGEEIVRTVTSDGQPTEYNSDWRRILAIPMVVLTSGSSASAAEIVSGALQRNDCAAIIGTTTYGKGSVQNIKDLIDGSRLKLTIQEYQLPGGVSIQDVGITPDITLVEHHQAEDGHIDMLPDPTSREVDDEFALKNQHEYAHTGAYSLGWLSKQLSKDEARRSSISSRDFVPDQEATLVIDLLKQAAAAPNFVADGEQADKNKTMRQFVIESLRAPVAQRAEAESAAVAAALMARTPPIIWGPATTAPASAFALTYTGPKTMIAGQEATLTFTVANNSAIPVGRMYGVVKADFLSPFWQQQVVFGAVPANGSTSATLVLKVPPRLYSGEERFDMQLFHDGQPDTLGSVKVRLGLEAAPRPHFSYTWKIQTTAADGEIHPDDADTLVLTLTNDGEGPSKKCELRVYKDDDPFVQLGENRVKLDPLPKDGSVTVKVPVKVLKQVKHQDEVTPFTGSSIKLQVWAKEQINDQTDELFSDRVSIINRRYQTTLFNSLVIPVNAPIAPTPVVQPFLTLEKITTDTPNHVIVDVKVVDSHLHYMNAFLEDDKIDMKPASALADGHYTVAVTLKPGANALNILAVDTDDMKESLPLRLWGEGEPAANTPSKPSAFPTRKH